MAHVKVPYLVVKPGAGDGMRYFWQPAKALRDCGWRPQRIPDGYATITDPDALAAAALAKARALNKEVEAWRSPSTAPAPAGSRPPPKKGEPQPGSLAAVIASYKVSRFFTTKRTSTQRTYLQGIAIIEAWSDHKGVSMPARAVTPKMVQEFYAKLYARAPGVANNAVRQLRIVLQHAIRENLIVVNPAVKPGLIGLAPSGRIWPQEAVDRFVATADAMGRHSVGTAVLLNAWLGQRQADVFKLKRSIVRDGELMLRQGKGGAGVKLPIGKVPALMARIAEELARQDGNGVVVPLDATRRHLIVNEATGLPYNKNTFNGLFAEIRAAAAADCPPFEIDYLVAGADDEEDPVITMAELQFMHLRHTAVVRLAEADCSAGLIRAITGHTLQSVNQILERYLVSTGEMAGAAFAKRLAKEQADG